MQHPFVNCLQKKAFKEKVGQQRKSENDGDSLLFEICNPFRLDFGKIIQSKAFRRLTEKTQVFCFPDNPHVRTRMTHTLEVSSLNSLIADVLGLNVELTMACSMGHDVGHVPFGHVGERFLSKYTEKDFVHNLFGPIVMEEVERMGKGLNLREETLSGIKAHSGADFKKEMEVEEYKVVKLGDKISYTFSDVNDAVRFDYISGKEANALLKKFGSNQRERIITCLFDLFWESFGKGTVSFSESKTAKMFLELREWMFKNVYDRANTRAIDEELSRAFETISEHPELKKFDPIVIFSILTENGVREIAQKGLSKERMFNLGITEIIPHLEEGRRYY